MNRRDFLACIGASFMAAPLMSFADQADRQTNVLIITADDLNWDSLGVTGCKVPKITPNVDRLASQGVLFEEAHVMTSICGPSRNALLSGRYPHCSGAMGHKTACPPDDWRPPMPQTPDLSTYLHDNGYFTGAINKHSRLIAKTFDVMYECEPWGMGSDDRDPQVFYERTKDFIEQSKREAKPFFLYDNIIDPHWPWPDTQKENELKDEYEALLGSERINREKYLKYPVPSSDYKPADIDVPGFLPDVPELREYLVPYFNSVKRMDDAVGQILKALDDCGQRDNTIVVFLSDNGITIPGGKWGCYYSSTKTPLIVRWPNKVSSGVRYGDSPVSSIDIMPTVIEALGLEPVKGIEGMSFFDILNEKSNAGKRGYVYTAANWLADGSDEQYYPMRAVADTDYLYIWNSFAISRDDITENAGGKDPVLDMLMKYKNSNPEYSEKAEIYLNRPVEELFNVANDPGCWYNLASDRIHRGKIDKARQLLLSEMKRTKDPELKIYQEYLAKESGRSGK